MPLSYDDDAAIHELTDNTDWRESYYLNFHDSTSDLHGVIWQGVKPNRERGEAVLCLWDDTTPLIYSIDMAVPVARDIGAERAAINAAFTCPEPWDRWDVDYRKAGDELHIEWTRLSETCDWEWGDLTDSKHFQAAGRVHVTGTVGGRAIDFQGYGERDRAWGPRNYDPIEFSWFVVAQWPDDVAVHAFAQRIDGDYRLMGYLHADGKTAPLTEFDASSVTYEPTDGPAKTSHLRWTDTLGRQVEADVERINTLSFGTSSGGSDLGATEPGSQAKGLMYLTTQTYLRPDGVLGKGMIDNNLHAGAAPDNFTAVQPNYSTLYDYGSTT
jgi:hypothetical protein